MLKEYPEKLWLGDYTLSHHQLTMTYGLDNMRFSCSYWYSDIDLLQLSQIYPPQLIEKLIFNIMCFQANKLCSLKPKFLDLGPLGKHWTPQLEKLWREVFFRVWGQWRYQNNFPDYHGPEVLKHLCENPKISPVSIKQGTPKSICFFGGGKDSLASTTILDSMGKDYNILTYTNSIYGSASKQINIIKGLIDQAVTKEYSYIYVYDDFVGCPILQLEHYSIKQLLAAETPSSIFSSLLLCLAKGYTEIILGHEKSADKGNLIWNQEDINHQWGKSSEAESLIRNYIQHELITNVTYFSILKSLYDIGIILVSSSRQDVIHLTHSCNIDKPWCKKCPKCCYVWLLYMATMPIDIINEMFGNANLLDEPQNQLHFRQLLGLEKHTPFECVGGIQEVKICFQLLRIKGMKGKAMDDFLSLPKEDYVLLFQKYSTIDSSYEGIPQQCHQVYLTKLEEIIGKQKKSIVELLKQK